MIFSQAPPCRRAGPGRVLPSGQPHFGLTSHVGRWMHFAGSGPLLSTRYQRRVFCPFEPKNRTKQRHPVCTGRQNCRRAGKVPCILPGGMYTETVPGLYYKPGFHSCIASGAAPLYVLREERYSPWLNVFTVKKTTKSARL